MINISQITKSYNGKYKAVDNLNLEIKDGEIYGLLGPNGAGKTTTIKMITGIIAPTSGNITINNIDIVENPVLAKEQFGYVPDSPDMFLRLTGMEYLNLMGDIYGVSSEDRKLRIKDMSERFEMNSALGDKIQSYSHANEGNTVLFSTHVLEVAEKICDKVAIINKGQLIFNGTLEDMREEFKASESLEEMFLELTSNE